MVGSWSQNIDMLEKAPNVTPDGFLQRYGIIVLLIYKVLSVVMFKGFKVVGVVSCGVCGDNSKVVRCGCQCGYPQGYRVVVDGLGDGWLGCG